KLCAERGQRTIFNFLGPLLNPARPTAQLVGVPRPDLCEPLAQVLQSLGVRRAMVVCGEVPGGSAASAPTSPRYLDEFSTLGPTTVAEFFHERGFMLSNYSNHLVELKAARLEDLSGGDKQTNARIICD